MATGQARWSEEPREIIFTAISTATPVESGYGGRGYGCMSIDGERKCKVPGGMDEISTSISVVRHKPTWRRDLRGVPQNSQNRRPLWEALVEGNSPPFSDLKMTSRGPELRPPSQSIPAWILDHQTQDDLYGAIPPAGGSAGPLAAYVGTFLSGLSLATLLAWVALSLSEG
ncbi:hypothetical protein E2C01_050997 [Portunus trituberculatus]|uniref:Uncharacterized protein n=1 Tax=Portunus trituberculatus TaxID=210409 RepID=A0A5B7GID6_PORTR|nr:hypothetical protein [Portunus trituberculatus]